MTASAFVSTEPPTKGELIFEFCMGWFAIIAFFGTAALGLAVAFIQCTA